jgi:hypothetical protein
MLPPFPSTFLRSLPDPSPTPVQANFLPDSTWIPPILQSIIGILLAGILAKIISDFWYKTVARPNIQAGFLEMSSPDKGHILTTRILQPQELNSHAIGIDLYIILDTKIPFAKDKWEARVNILPDENVHIEGLTMLVPKPKSYRLFSGEVSRGTTVMLRGMNLTQPFANLGKGGTIRMFVTVDNVSKIIPLTLRNS